MRKIVSVFVLCGLIISLSGCFGSFNLIQNVYQANDDVSDNEFVKSAVMVGMFIIPIYEVAGIADLLVFNVIEFWSGENPIAMSEGDRQRQVIHANGNVYQLDAVKDHLIISDLSQGGKEMWALNYDRSKGCWSVDDQGTNALH